MYVWMQQSSWARGHQSKRARPLEIWQRRAKWGVQLKWAHKKVAAALIVVGLIGASFLIPAQKQICGKNPYTAQKECATYQITVAWIITAGEFLEYHAGAITALATAFIGVFTYTLNKNSKRQAELTEILERAFITVEPRGVKGIHDNRAIGQVEMRNSGGLPATAIRWNIRMEIDRDKMRKIFDIAEPDIGDSTNLLAPNATMPRFVAEKLKRTVELTSNGAALYIWGKVYYLDGFGNQRWTRFCHRYEQDCLESGVGPNVLSDRARQHQYGNGTDEDES